MYKQFSQITALIVLLALLQVTSSCQRKENLSVGKKISCSAEHLNKSGKQLITSNSHYLLDGGKQRTMREAHTGKYSVATFPRHSFAFGFSTHAGPDYYYKISVWRKSKSENGILVATTQDSKRFYQAENKPADKGANGWEKIEMEVFTPPFFDDTKDRLMVYVWNKSKDTVYFDDFSIERFAKKIYPSYKEAPLSIVFDTSEYLKLKKKRKIAFENGILQSTENDWVKGIVFGDGKMMKAKLRLKGDWLDHLYGDKWSLRIKLKKKHAWRRLRVFSIQTPAARDYLMEWASHRFYESRDILTTRYGFVPVLFNNQSRGIYAYEEHFVKQLVESRKRREGPIVKFSEDAFWQMQKIDIKLRKWIKIPFFESSVIEPFSQSKTIKSPTLYKEFLDAQKLMYQYKNHLSKPADIFDINKLAKYYAMLDLTLARHGMSWHNQRFYYNPILCKLEPIAFDGYTDHNAVNTGINSNFMYKAYHNKNIVIEEKMNYELFTDPEFVKKYLYFLGQFSKKSFIDSVSLAIAPEAHLYDSLIKREFPDMLYDFDFFKKSANKIRAYLPVLKQFAKNKLNDTAFRFKVKPYIYNDTLVLENTPEYLVNAYLESRSGTDSRIFVENYFQQKITVLGTGRKKKNINYHFNLGKTLKHFLSGKPDTLTVTSDTNAQYLFFLVESTTYVVKIHPWPKLSGITTQQQLLQNARLDLPVIKKVEGKNIYFKTGKHRVDYPIVIPRGYTVYFKKGTILNFVKKAMFISYSPVIIRGSKHKPVVFTSSDFSANGFTVLQPKGKSVLHYVRFENFNTLNYKDWIITGAVTFYESTLDINNLTIYRNQCEDALNLIRCNFLMDSSRFDNTHSDAFDSDFSNGLVENSTFTYIGNDALDFSGSHIDIKNCYISQVADKGVSGGENSHITIENTTIEKANIGIASKDLSSVKAQNSLIKDCNYGVVLLQKKPEFGPATMQIINVRFVNPKTKLLIEKGSSVMFNGKLLQGSKTNVAKIFY